MRQQLRIALKDRSYLLLNAGFFTCGFHIAFLVTHLPGEVALCGLSSSVSGISIALIGLANIVGSRGARPTVASPVYKQVFDLATGECLDDPAVRLPVHLVRVRDGLVEVALEAEAMSA